MSRIIVLSNPTFEELYRARLNMLEDLNRDAEKELYILKNKIGKQREKIFFLEQAVETARGEWARYGAEKALSNLVLKLKENR